MTRLHPPTWATIALSVLAGVLELLNVVTFGFAAPWQNLVTIGLAALAAIGIGPLTGPALQNVIHLSHRAALAIATILTTAVVAITTLPVDETAKGILTGVLTIIAGVLFGPAGPAHAPVPPPAPAT